LARQPEVSDRIQLPVAIALRARIDNLVGVACSDATGRQEHELRIRLQALVTYRQFLEIVIGRWREARDMYNSCMAEFGQLMEAKASHPAPQSCPVAERALLDRLSAIEPHVRLEPDSFYLFSKILLDRLADVFSHYFGEQLTTAGSTYAKLVKDFGEIAARRELVEATGTTLAKITGCMKYLKDDIVYHRNKALEHVPDPGWTSITLAHDSTIPIIRRTSDWGRATGDPEQLLTDIDKHLDAILSLLEVNVERCALRGKQS
jgi:hypothetical protein